MKKYLAAAVLVLLAFGSRPARAEFYQPIISSIVVTGVNVSSFTPTQMGTLPSGFTQAEIQNLDPVTTNYLLCNVGPSAASVTISTSTSRYILGGNAGSAGTSWSLGLNNYLSSLAGYPVSVTEYIWCETTRVGGFTAGAPNAICTLAK